MYYKFNVKELELIINGLDAAADRPCPKEELKKYNKLNKRLSESLEFVKDWKEYYDSKYNNNMTSN